MSETAEFNTAFREELTERHTNMIKARAGRPTSPVPDYVATVPCVIYSPPCGHRIRLHELLDDLANDWVYCQPCRTYYVLATCKIMRPVVSGRPATNKMLGYLMDKAIIKTRVAVLIVKYGERTHEVDCMIAEQVGCSQRTVERVAQDVETWARKLHIERVYAGEGQLALAA
jgi:hypothetical protein